MSKNYIFIIFITFSLCNAVTFDKTYDGSAGEISMSVKSTADGGYIIAGSTESSGAGGHDGYLIKTDQNGNVEWEKTTGSTSNDIFNDIQQTFDEGFIAVGSKNRYDVVDSDGNFWMVKFDKNGKEKWSVSFEDSLNVYVPSKIKIMRDGGFIVIGSARTSEQSILNDVWVLRTDNSGSVIWSKKYQNGVLNYGLDIVLDRNYMIDERYTLLCYKNGDGFSDVSAWLLTIDIAGSVIDEGFINLNPLSAAISFIQNSDGSFVLVGKDLYEVQPFILDDNILLIKVYPNFTLAWKKSYGNTQYEQSGSYVLRTTDGFVVIGTQESPDYQDEFLLVKFDSNGNKVWEREYGSELIEWSSGNILQTSDNGFIFTGTSNMTSFYVNYVDGDISLIKTDENGYVIYPPIITSFDITSNNISINWDPVSNAGSYIVYNSDRVDSNFVPVDTTAVNTWNTVAADSLNKKFYYIKASTNNFSK